VGGWQEACLGGAGKVHTRKQLRSHQAIQKLTFGAGGLGGVAVNGVTLEGRGLGNEGGAKDVPSAGRTAKS